MILDSTVPTYLGCQTGVLGRTQVGTVCREFCWVLGAPKPDPGPAHNDQLLGGSSFIPGDPHNLGKGMSKGGNPKQTSALVHLLPSPLPAVRAERTRAADPCLPCLLPWDCPWFCFRHSARGVLTTNRAQWEVSSHPHHKTVSFPFLMNHMKWPSVNHSDLFSRDISYGST